MKPYPQISKQNIRPQSFEDVSGFFSDIRTVLDEIHRLRDQDIREFNNLKSIFIRGRKVEKIPTAFDDVDDTDRLGDFNYDETYEYRLVDDSGTPKWARNPHGSIAW